MYKSATLMTIGLIAAWGSAALAEGPAGPGRTPPKELLDRGFNYLDANGDGQIDRTEFQQRMPQVARRIMARHGQGRAGRGPQAGRRMGPPHGQRGRRGRGMGRGMMGFGPGDRSCMSQRGFGRRGLGPLAMEGDSMGRGPMKRGLRGGRGMGAGREGCRSRGSWGKGHHRRGRGGSAMAFAGPLDRMIDAKIEGALRGSAPQAGRRGRGHGRMGRRPGPPPHRGGPAAKGQAPYDGDGCPLAMPAPPAGPRTEGSRGRGRGEGRQQRPPRGGRHRAGRESARPPLMGALDLNGDNKIDKKEVSQAIQALKKLDTDENGVLDLHELTRIPAPGGRGGDLDRPGRGRRPRSSEPAGRGARTPPKG